jgi:hypothetical protein
MILFNHRCGNLKPYVNIEYQRKIPEAFQFGTSVPQIQRKKRFNFASQFVGCGHRTATIGVGGGEGERKKAWGRGPTKC